MRLFVCAVCAGLVISRRVQWLQDPEALEETKVIHELWAHQSESEVEQSYALLVSQNEQEFYEEFARPMVSETKLSHPRGNHNIRQGI